MTMYYTVQERLCFSPSCHVLQPCHAYMSTWTLFVECAIKTGAALTLSGLPSHLPNGSTGVET